MRNKNYFTLLAFCSFFIFINSGLAQKSDVGDVKVTNFGASLKKIDKKRNKTKSIKQTDYNADEDSIIRVDTTLIVNDIMVFDKKGNPVKDLKKEDFIVKEDDEPQEIEIFTSGDGAAIPRSIVLVIDYSPSQLPYIETSVEAAKVLVDKLDPQDRMAIVTDDVELVQDFTRDKTLLKEKLELLKNNALSGTTGRSRQFSALMAALNEMFDAEVLRPIIIFQTDGDELALLKKEKANFSSSNKETVNFSYDNILTATEKSRATIYSIIPGARFTGISKNERLKRAKTYLINNQKTFAEVRKIIFDPEKIKITEKVLKSHAELLFHQQSAVAEIARLTGGWTDYLEQPEQADKIYSEILSGINRRYIIGYYPTNQTRNGKVRKVKTEVRGYPEYVILGRKTYITTDN